MKACALKVWKACDLHVTSKPVPWLGEASCGTTIGIPMTETLGVRRGMGRPQRPQNRVKPALSLREILGRLYPQKYVYMIMWIENLLTVTCNNVRTNHTDQPSMTSLKYCQTCRRELAEHHLQLLAWQSLYGREAQLFRYRHLFQMFRRLLHLTTPRTNPWTKPVTQNTQRNLE